MKDESNCFDACNLTTAKPAVSDSLLVEITRPKISSCLTLKQQIISGNMTLKQPKDSGNVTLKQPRKSGNLTLKQQTMSSDLSQQFIHLLTPPVKNSNPEKLR